MKKAIKLTGDTFRYMGMNVAQKSGNINASDAIVMVKDLEKIASEILPTLKKLQEKYKTAYDSQNQQVWENFLRIEKPNIFAELKGKKIPRYYETYPMLMFASDVQASYDIPREWSNSFSCLEEFRRILSEDFDFYDVKSENNKDALESFGYCIEAISNFPTVAKEVIAKLEQKGGSKSAKSIKSEIGDIKPMKELKAEDGYALIADLSEIDYTLESEGIDNDGYQYLFVKDIEGARTEIWAGNNKWEESGYERLL